MGVFALSAYQNPASVALMRSTIGSSPASPALFPVCSIPDVRAPHSARGADPGGHRRSGAKGCRFRRGGVASRQQPCQGTPMGLLHRVEAARSAAGACALRALDGAVTGAVTAVGLAAAPAVLTAGLLSEPGRAATQLARSAAGGSLSLARKAAASGTRAVGTVVTGADPIPDGHVRHLADVVRGMLEPQMARHTRRVWAGRGHVHIEVAAPPAEEQPEVRRALRRHLERLEGVQWATVNDVVGRVLVAIDDRQISVEEVVGVVTAVEQSRGGTQVFPQRQDHPADLEPLMAALLDATVETVAVGVGLAGRGLFPGPTPTPPRATGIPPLGRPPWPPSQPRGRG